MLPDCHSGDCGFEFHLDCMENKVEKILEEYRELNYVGKLYYSKLEDRVIMITKKAIYNGVHINIPEGYKRIK